MRKRSAILSTKRNRTILVSAVILLFLCFLSVQLYLNRATEDNPSHPCHGLLSEKQVDPLLPGEEHFTEEIDKDFPRKNAKSLLLDSGTYYCTLSRGSDDNTFTVRIAYPQEYRTAESQGEVDLKFGDETGIYTTKIGRLGLVIHCSTKPRENNYPMLTVDVGSTYFEGMDARQHPKRFQRLATITGDVTRKVAQRYECPDREKLTGDAPVLVETS